MGKVDWAKLDDDWFLLPNLWKVHFTTGIAMGTNDGRHISLDEYGHSPRYPSYRNEKRREKERETFEEGKREWAKRQSDKTAGSDLGFSAARIPFTTGLCGNICRRKDWWQARNLRPNRDLLVSLPDAIAG